MLNYRIAFFLFLASILAAQPNYTLRSPNGRIEMRISAGDRLRYSVLLQGRTLMQDSTLTLDIDQKVLGVAPKVASTKERTVDQSIEPAVRQKSAKIREHFNELRLDLESNHSAVFRAYDHGVAYRWETSLPQREVKVVSEEAGFNFAGDVQVYYPKEESLFSHNERQFLFLKMRDIKAADIASIPAVVDAGGGIKLVVCDSDVEDYPGLWLRGTGGNGLTAFFPPFPLEEKLTRDRDLRVTKTAPYIAATSGTRTYPWRLVGITEKDADLLTNPLVFLLAKPSQVADTSWIKPGMVAWDWWNANNISGVDFKAGINTATYKYYIDFASKYGLEYIILDEGWYKLGNVLQVVPEMNIEELVAYGKKKNVGIILWVVWKTFDDQFEAALNQFEKWGVKGLKVDFMQRDDQPVMNFYHKVSREAAKRKMLVDFHGAIRPALMTRTWPNLLTTEGVRGLEQLKWSDYANPEHNVTLPFTRMFVGPMDYTPGGMINASRKEFVPIFTRPMSMGTRAHQLAMYVIYESPLQMLADSPTHYLREPDAMRFLSAVPTVWDETTVLDAKMGDYVVVARRSGREWYVGAMTDWTSRALEVSLSFLPAGNFQMESWQDGVNANQYGNDYRVVKSAVNKSTRLKIKLAEGGGWAARVSPGK